MAILTLALAAASACALGPPQPSARARVVVRIVSAARAGSGGIRAGSIVIRRDAYDPATRRRIHLFEFQ